MDLADVRQRDIEQEFARRGIYVSGDIQTPTDPDYPPPEPTEPVVIISPGDPPAMRVPFLPSFPPLPGVEVEEEPAIGPAPLIRPGTAQTPGREPLPTGLVVGAIALFLLIIVAEKQPSNGKKKAKRKRAEEDLRYEI